MCVCVCVCVCVWVCVCVCVRVFQLLALLDHITAPIKPEHHPPPVQSPSTLEPPTLSINQSAGRNNSYAFLPTSSETGLHLPLLSASVHNHSLPQSPTVPHLPTLPSHPPPTHGPQHNFNYCNFNGDVTNHE